MAVVETQSTGEGQKNAPKGSFFKKNKALVIIGGIGGTILLLSHKGSQGGSPNSQLQDNAATQQALAQENAALNSGAVLPLGAPPEPMDSTTQEPSGVTTTGTAGQGEDTEPQGQVTDPNDAVADAAVAAALGAEASADAAAGSSAATTQHGGTTKKPASKHPQHGKHPTKAQGHHNTGHTGTTVHGRHFPGATGHTMGNSHKNAAGTHQQVKVHYGGRTDTHISHNGGKSWTDHAPGANPPSRGTPHRSTAHGPHRAAPPPRVHTVAVAAPAPRPVARAAAAPPPHAAPRPAPRPAPRRKR